MQACDYKSTGQMFERHKEKIRSGLKLLQLAEKMGKMSQDKNSNNKHIPNLSFTNLFLEVT